MVAFFQRIPEFGQLVHAVPTTGMYGTDPAGGENIIVFIKRRDFGFRLTIAADEAVIVIDIW